MRIGIPSETKTLEGRVALVPAAAADLVRGKTAGRPVAVVRGLDQHITHDDGPGAASIIRPAEEDMFRTGG